MHEAERVEESLGLHSCREALGNQFKEHLIFCLILRKKGCSIVYDVESVESSELITAGLDVSISAQFEKKFNQEHIRQPHLMRHQ